ncbi:hypothetical protein GCM10010435_61370 [Winogradskya consettensis]|uniref:Uncharacterized protein n=1 Tax=Winogradskya consettensis TaxID=113560 RepID=A0A919SRK0_9ACTN|nr:hypothetical protein [Actinoplanes consettensis]GIM76202.1 hypothetical protein Aco04nite_49190 [Actinoplanes consettensis]
MTTYSGPARLILPDGTPFAGMASLSTNYSGGQTTWSGTFRPNQATAELQDVSDELRLELPYEQTGAVAVTGVRKFLASQVMMSLAGRGPAPF